MDFPATALSGPRRAVTYNCCAFARRFLGRRKRVLPGARRRRTRSHPQGWREMKLSVRKLVLLSIMASFMASTHAQSDMEIGGQKIVTISRKAASTTKPEFTSVTVLPGRGMELLQITPNFPGKGQINVLASPDVAGAKDMLDNKDTANGDLAY